MTEHGSHRQHESGQAELLDLDAEVVGHLGELTAWVGQHVESAPRAIVDVGAGTGTGTLALVLGALIGAIAGAAIAGALTRVGANAPAPVRDPNTPRPGSVTLTVTAESAAQAQQARGILAKQGGDIRA